MRGLYGALDPGLPQEGHALELVTVLETRDSFAVMLAKASLEEAGIAYVVNGEDPGYFPGCFSASGLGATPLWNCSCQIQVPAEFEREARALVEPLQSPAETASCYRLYPWRQ